MEFDEDFKEWPSNIQQTSLLKMTILSSLELRW